MNMVSGVLALLSLIAVSLAANAAPPSFGWPVDCRLGEDCWIVHHVDSDPELAAEDFRCGALTYNNHKGTDIAVRDRAAIYRPVPVVAAADGIVAGFRDNAPDHLGDESAIRTSIDKGEECGNGLLIQHAGGWSTQYCHLKAGSLIYGKGQMVSAGDVIGHLGNSGAASFPHLHFAVRRDKTVVDPFTGLPMGAGCGAKPVGSLWDAAAQAALPNRDEPMLFGVGFRANAPRYDALLQDMRSPQTLKANGPGLVLWAIGYGMRKGDVMAFEITAPDGQYFTAKRFEQPKNQIRRMRFVGRSNKNAVLRAGTYHGLVRVTRLGGQGATPLVIERRVSVELVK